MNCLRCGARNNQNASRCGSCGATLPRNFGQASLKSSFDLQDHRSYEAPTQSYANSGLDALEEAIDAWFNGEESGSRIAQAISDMRHPLADLVADLDIGLGAIQAQKEADPDDLPHQIGYLLQAGVRRFSEALETLEPALQGNEEQIDPILEELRVANDYICHSAALIGQLFAREGQQIETEQLAKGLAELAEG